MMLIRPVKMGDLEQLEQLAIEVGVGMTSLPARRDHLENKIQRSLESFVREIIEPGEEIYWLVLEDAANGRVVGSCAILASVGLTRPFYSYKILHLAHTSRELDKYQPFRVLQMVNEYRGTAEIATLYLTPEYRKDRNGRFLSRCRFLFMAEFSSRVSETVIAEMRGVQDERGHSVFWDSLGRHFFDMAFSKADFLSSLGNYQFIADLMPKHPIYICLLPPEAQAVIGITHEATRPALELLKQEGFRFDGCVDIFDAGPTITCPLDQIRTVRESTRATVAEVVAAIESAEFMISTVHLDDFRVCRGNLRMHADNTVSISREVAGALGLRLGDKLRFVRL